MSSEMVSTAIPFESIALAISALFSASGLSDGSVLLLRRKPSEFFGSRNADFLACVRGTGEFSDESSGAGI